MQLGFRLVKFEGARQVSKEKEKWIGEVASMRRGEAWIRNLGASIGQSAAFQFMRIEEVMSFFLSHMERMTMGLMVYLGDYDGCGI